MKTEDYAIFQTWDYVVENFQYLIENELFFVFIGLTAVVAFFFGRFSK